MGKISKRQKKFQTTGGVKRRLDKGTITHKGKLPSRSNKKQRTTDTKQKSPASKSVTPNKSKQNDFLGEENIADLDIDTFFTKVAEEASQMVEDKSDDDEQSEDGSLDGPPNQGDDDGDDDDDGDSASGDEGEKPKRANDKKKESDSDSASSSGSDDDNDEAVKDAGKSSKRKQKEEDSSSEEDSDDEDIEAAEARMKAEMSKLSKDDPEFHEFLQENEETLLEFGQDEAEDDEGEESEQDEDREAGESSKKPTQNQIHLTKKVLDTLVKGTFTSHGTKNLKKLVAAYKSACHLADASGANEGEARPGESGSLYLIDSSKIFDELMMLCLNRLHEEFHYHLLREKTGSTKKAPAKANKDDGKSSEDNVPSDDNKPLNPKVLERAERWTDMKPIILSFFRSTLHVMSEAKEPELLSFILKALSKYLHFLTPFPRIAETMLKRLTALWSAPLDTSEDYQVVRLNAFFRIRQLALTQPFPFIEAILKTTYLAYARRAKFGTAAAVSTVLPTLTFMGNCLCELYSLDHHSSYQHAFVYIRQLALLLRAAMHKKTAEAMQQVYCWQYIHCLKLWVAVLSDAVTAEEDKNHDAGLMRSLIYPLTEVILGTVRFVPSPARHLPLRLHCVRLLQQLAASSEVFIPTTSLLLECFDFKEWYMAPKRSHKAAGHGPLQLEYILKLQPKEDALRTHEQREASINALLLLLNREVELYRYSAGFPEFSIRIVQRLRSFSKQASSQSRWRVLARSCIETCEQYVSFAVQARSKLLEAPKDVQRLECLLPAGEKNMKERHEESLDREKKQLQQLLATDKATVASKDKPDADNEENANEAKSSKKKKRKSKGKASKDEGKQSDNVQVDDHALEQEDKVQEGIDWSDDGE